MRIGIDIGGSHIGIGLVDINGKIIEKEEKNIIWDKCFDIKKFIEIEIINVITNWATEKNYNIESIGIGIPGIVKDGEVKYSVNLGISDYNLEKILKKHFPQYDTKIKNDAKCAGLAEKKLGALKTYGDCIFICLGTGIGGAAFYNNELIIPNRSSGFEFGHMIIQRDGEPCRCGSKGCFENYGSMRRFKNDIRSVLHLSNEIEGKELLDILKDNSL